jgi:hypothetical protein
MKNGSTEQSVGPFVRFVRRHPWLLFVPGILLGVLAMYAVWYLVFMWILIFPFVLIPLLVLGPIWYGLGGGWRCRSYPRMWFGAGYTLGLAIIPAQLWVAVST